VVVCGDAAACITPYQTAKLKKGQRLISNSGCASMGYDLPAAVGAAIARGGQRVICLAGDGSVHLNIQELQTLVHHKLPVKLIVLNNGGYLSMRQTQSNFFGRLIGAGPSSGVSFPDYTRVANAYGIPAVRIDHVDCLQQLWTLLESPGPALCEIMLDPAQEFEPRLKIAAASGRDHRLARARRYVSVPGTSGAGVEPVGEEDIKMAVRMSSSISTVR